MRATWDAAAASPETYVGPAETAAEELESLFGRLGGDPRGGTCVEVGCGVGRMTRHLRARFERVIAVDVSPAMLDAARRELPDVDFRLVDGARLDSVEDGVAGTLVCYLVLQHLPSRRAVRRYFGEFARVLAPHGEAYVQLPVLRGLRGFTWRALRSLAVPLGRAAVDVERRPEYRGVRITDGELERAIARAGLRVLRRDEKPDSPYRYARDVFLRLARA